jgi:Spy/CpxP family protein refolding chaperone
MKNRGLLKFALVASLVLNFAFLATAGYIYYQKSAHWVSPFGVKMKKDRFLFEELSLKPEQREALRSRMIPYRAEIDQQRQELIEKRKTLIALMRADNLDTKAVDSAIKEINDMQEDMQRKIAAHILEVKASLDKDQQLQFLDLLEKNMATRQAGCTPMGHGR